MHKLTQFIANAVAQAGGGTSHFESIPNTIVVLGSKKYIVRVEEADDSDIDVLNRMDRAKKEPVF